jgi:hypothetical protein
MHYNAQSNKEIKEAIPFTIVSKILRNKTREGRTLLKTIKCCWKKSKKTHVNGKTFCVLHWKTK